MLGVAFNKFSWEPCNANYVGDLFLKPLLEKCYVNMSSFFGLFTETVTMNSYFSKNCTFLMLLSDHTLVYVYIILTTYKWSETQTQHKRQLDHPKLWTYFLFGRQDQGLIYLRDCLFNLNLSYNDLFVVKYEGYLV